VERNKLREDAVLLATAVEEQSTAIVKRLQQSMLLVAPYDGLPLHADSEQLYRECVEKVGRPLTSPCEKWRSGSAM
jgi:hypothetical protein